MLVRNHLDDFWKIRIDDPIAVSSLMRPAASTTTPSGTSPVSRSITFGSSQDRPAQPNSNNATMTMRSTSFISTTFSSTAARSSTISIRQQSITASEKSVSSLFQNYQYYMFSSAIILFLLLLFLYLYCTRKRMLQLKNARVDTQTTTSVTKSSGQSTTVSSLIAASTSTTATNSSLHSSNFSNEQTWSSSITIVSKELGNYLSVYIHVCPSLS